MQFHGRKLATIAVVSAIGLAGAFNASASAATVPEQSVSFVPPDLAPAAAPHGHLTYHGGPIINNVEVTPLVWGSWNYGSATGTVNITQARLTSVFNVIVNSPHMDWLSEYNAGGFHIGRGTVDPWATVHPGAGNDGGTVTDAQIASVLRNQIASGALPPASNNRLYTLFFRQGQVISTSFGNSRTRFCGYHNSTTVNGQNVWYAVLPFEAHNSGCQKPGFTRADNLQAVMSHEIIEAVTDPGVLRTAAWFDNTTGAEIGDICAWRFGNVGGFVLQKEWSNSARACIVQR